MEKMKHYEGPYGDLDFKRLSDYVFVQDHKIEQAKNYLKHTSYSVLEISYHLNFGYPNYFARLFRKITGLTPTQYKEEKGK